MSKINNNNGENNMNNIDTKKVEEVRKFIWDMYTELRKMRGKRKKIDIFAVEMTMMQLGVLANGMTKDKTKKESA
jgi:hypothetical protein